MTFKETLKEEMVQIDAAIKEFFEAYIKSGTLNHDFVVQFYSDLKNYLLFGGKRLRPLSCVVLYKGLGGMSEDIYKVAISVELLHNASLVHDDIIDHDVMRRGQPSFHAFYTDWFEKNLRKYSEQADFGLAMGILGGDLLVELGQEAILNSRFDNNEKLKAVGYYFKAYRELIEGVAGESYMQNLPLEKVTEAEYLTMIGEKTGALFQKSLLIGAVFADKTEKYKTNITEFGTFLGQAFQIRDDILGTFGDPKETGKSNEGDIKEGKKTLLAIYGSENPQIRELYGKKDMTAKEIQIVKRLLKETGALERAKAKATKLAEKASENLRKIKLNDTAMNFFQDLIKFVQERLI
ncbi:MAG: polyprenyl synthetase family protein [Candidatus Helarchaeota archaeon]|nr:polyprenyl synthetase family protein [Candidatus Helarchaeota archaeon]